MSEKTKKKSAAKKIVTAENYKNKIVTFLQTYDKKLMPLSELETKCRTKKSGREEFTVAFALRVKVNPVVFFVKKLCVS